VESTGYPPSMPSALLDALYAWLPVLEPRARRRRRTLALPFPAGWEEILQAEVPFWSRLSESRRARARPMIHAFVAEHRWVGAHGLEVSEEMQVVVAACAVRPVLNLGLEYYDHLSEIVLYAHDQLTVPEHGQGVLGLAHQHGVIVLSWPAVQEGLQSPTDGHDTALHEFVHLLDLADGSFDGAPPLRRAEDVGPWARTLAARFEAMREGSHTVLRDYAAHSPPEFFAVASEHFFERPAELRRAAPDLYAQLKRFYGWDPGRRAPTKVRR